MVLWLRFRVRRLWGMDTGALEVMLSFIALMWGAQLGQPAPIFALPVYVHMAAVASEGAWAIAMTALGAAQITALLSANRPVRRLGLLTSTLMWSFVSMLFWLSLPFGTATSPGVYVVLAAMSMWAFLRLGR
jgi:hypothetical protein